MVFLTLSLQIKSDGSTTERRWSRHCVHGRRASNLLGLMYDFVHSSESHLDMHVDPGGGKTTSICHAMDQVLKRDFGDLWRLLLIGVAFCPHGEDLMSEVSSMGLASTPYRRARPSNWHWAGSPSSSTMSA